MPPMLPGQSVRITQTVPRLSGAISTAVEGTVLRHYRAKTGSWFAHAKDHKLWLDRLDIRKPNGELATLNLDPYTTIEVLPAAQAS
jgi:hypothetical protein